ncbi:hypothetical protein [Rhizobium multihospitium]|uniref:Uncharacterized protein n=1 Tax=Rhizobium multihospitium TaxID=410764 RepID=A0A1C3XBQ3_9HYPH|nr:hypothetical protein [Rhizobium multihospitium]SCB49595.1 hypothetical protein GA0061103_0631 [Rhizobium multihospitium]
MIPDETADLLETLLFTIRMIVDGDAQDKQRITDAYREARSLAASLGLDGGSARPRIVACLERFNTYKDGDDVAAAGWMLTAIQERLGEHNLYGWRKLQDIVDAAINELLLFEKVSLH